MTRNKLSLVTALFASVILFANGVLADSVLTQLSGDVQIGRGEPAEWTVAKAGDSVAPNARVRTGSNGRVEIKMDAGTIRVHENSMLRLPPAKGDSDQIELEEGRSLFDVLRRKGRRFEVRTPTVVVSVKGTRFGVDAGIDVGEVTVYRGTVGVREAGAADMMETLVREGFLATGGVGMPIELDVSSTEDPWNAWREVNGAANPRGERPIRLGELDRARAVLHRATAANVIAKAAERRPEIAKRLLKIQEQQREKAAEEDDESDPNRSPKMRPDRESEVPRSMPAAARFGSEDGAPVRHEMRRRGLSESRERALEASPIIDKNRAAREVRFKETALTQDLSNAGGLSANGIHFDFKALYDLSPAALLLVRGALTEINGNFQSGGFVPTGPTDVLTQLNAELITMGLTPLQARITVQTVTGATVP